MLKIVLIGLAGMAGTLGRYRVSAAATWRYGGRLPLDTLAVNVVGCFAIGLLARVIRGRFAAGETAGAVVMAGLPDGFKTFSSYGLQAFAPAREGFVTHAAAYVVASNVLGLPTVWAGHDLARTLLPA